MRDYSSYVVHSKVGRLAGWSFRAHRDPPRDSKVFRLRQSLSWEEALSIQEEVRLIREGRCPEGDGGKYHRRGRDREDRTVKLVSDALS